VKKGPFPGGNSCQGLAFFRLHSTGRERIIRCAHSREKSQKEKGTSYSNITTISQDTREFQGLGEGTIVLWLVEKWAGVSDINLIEKGAGKKRKRR